MTTLLNDLSYIPLNNEHNEPTQGDIGETSIEPIQATHNEFEELYSSANEVLYPGCDYVTRLDFMAKFTYFKVKGKLTDSIFNEMLEFFQNVFLISKGYKLPPSYYAIKKTFKTIGLGYESIHACKHDCCLFRGGDNKDLDFCLVCNTSRWKDSNTPRKKVPKKVLCYFLIILRLQRLYKSSHTAKEMIWHATRKCTQPGKMQHPVDGRAWKNFDTNQAYNMWPVILTTYNLPPWLYMKESSFMLTLLIPGPKSPGKDIDVYLRPLIKDLKLLGDRKGVETIDIPSGQKFNMRAMVLWTINDFLARSSLSGWSGQGLKSHDYHILMQRLLPYGLKNYLPNKIAKPIIKLRSLFKQICSATLMENDMLKAQIKVVDIQCDLELIYPPALFDIMIHMVIHLPLEALEGGPIHPRWMFPFERYMKKLKDNDKDPEVSTTSELFALAYGPTWTPISINSCVVDGVRHVVHNRDERRTAQNIGICSPGLDGEMGVIVVEDDPDIIHFENSSDLPLFTSLNDLDNATLHIDGQSTEVDAPPDIIDVVDQDDDITDDEDAFPHDLADSDDEDLINVDDGGVDKMSADVARSHSGEGGDEDRPPPHHVPSDCMGCFANREHLIDLRQHMEYPPDWTEESNKTPSDRTIHVKKIGRARPEDITTEEWDKYIQFWNDPRNIARAAQNRQNRAKSTVISRQGSREEMRRLEAMGTYTDDEIKSAWLEGLSRVVAMSKEWREPGRRESARRSGVREEEMA
ncbi:hypothetical protein Tco_1409776 [Tanacetum coccineum]